MLKESLDGGPREVLENVGYTDLLLTANSAQCFEEKLKKQKYFSIKIK